MYVGVIWCFLFHVLQLLPIRFTQQMVCCTNKPTMKHLQEPDWESYLPWFSYGYRKCMFAYFLTMYIDPPNYVRNWMWSSD